MGRLIKHKFINFLKKECKYKHDNFNLEVYKEKTYLGEYKKNYDIGNTIIQVKDIKNYIHTDKLYIDYNFSIINTHQELKKILNSFKKGKIIKFDLYKNERKIYFLYKFLDEKESLLHKIKNLNKKS